MALKAMKYDNKAIKTKLAEALENQENENLSDRQKRDIVFHLTDWLSDLEKWSVFCENPSQYSADEARHILYCILVHIPEHIAAAAKLLMNQPVRDIFNVGATTEEE